MSATDDTRAARAAAALDDVRNALGRRAQKYARDADLGAMVRELVAEADAAREIIDGRATPPTDAQAMAHAAAGGWWLLRDERDHDNPRVLLALDAHRGAALAEARAGERDGVRWWPLDASGRPCAWPEVQP